MLHHHLGRMMSHGVMRCSPMGIVSSIAGTLSFNLVAAYKIKGASTGTKDATLTNAGRLLRDYADRLLRLSEEAETAVKDLRDLRRGRVLIGANEASVHAVLPLIQRFREAHPLVHVDVRRIPARQIGAEVAQGSLDFGVLTFQPAEPRLGSIVLGQDELVMLVHP